MANLTSSLGIERIEQVALQHAEVVMLRDNVSAVEAQLLQLLARSEADAAELRRELRAAARGHRVEVRLRVRVRV